MSTEENIHLWESFLMNTSSRGSQAGEGTLLVVGDEGSGKHSLIRSLRQLFSHKKTESTSTSFSQHERHPISPIKETKQSQQNKDEDEKSGYRSVEYISYECFSTNEEDGKVNVWSTRSDSWRDMTEVVLQPERVEQGVILVVVDLSKPHCATGLFSLLTDINSSLKEYSSRCSELASHQGDMGQEEAKEHPSESTHRPRVVVVGSKADQLEASGVESMARSKATQGAVRAVCLTCHADSLVFTSTKTPPEATSSNVEVLQRHLVSCLSTRGREAASASCLMGDGSIQDGTTDVIIPDVSSDSVELIRSATDVEVEQVIASIRSSIDSMAKKTVSLDTPTGDSSSAGLMDESQWLQQFQSSAPVETLPSDSRSSASTSTSTAPPSRRKSTLENPLASIGSKSSPATGFSMPDKESKGPRKKKALQPEKGEKSARGFFEGLL